MDNESQFPKAPPLRFELTEDQAAALDAAKPPGEAALILGYAQRHPWPDPKRFTLFAWFIPIGEAEAALMASGTMAPAKKNGIKKMVSLKKPVDRL
jgi:hypothetical protein